MVSVLERRPPSDRDAALRSLVDAHSGALFAYVVRQVSDRQRAEDIVQEVFFRAWKRAETFQSARGDLRGWLFAIARNLVIDSHRADAARPRVVADDTALATVAVPDEVESSLAAWTMREALLRLTPTHREVIYLLHYRRLTLAESAVHLRVPLGTVKSRSTYALRALRLVLEEMEVTG